MAGMRIGGLASGMDIDQIVGDLMKAQRIPLDKLLQKKTTFEWQRDSYRSINTKLKTFDTYLFDNFSLSSNFNKKTVESSNSNIVSATATGSASSNLSIEGVSQLATAARQIGKTVSTSTGGTATGSTKMSELTGISGDTSISLKAIQADGTLAKEATKIEIKATDTIDQVVKKINDSNAGVSALFENGKLSITAKNTGDIKGGAEVQVTEGNNVFTALGMTDSTNLASGGTNAVFQVNGISTERSSNTFMISGYNVTLKSTFNVKNTIEGQVAALKKASEQAIVDVTNAENAKKTAEDNLPVAQSKYDTEYAKLSGNAKNFYDNSVADSANLKNVLANTSENELTEFVGLSGTTDADIDANTTLSADTKKLLKSLSVEEREALKNVNSNDFSSLKTTATADNQLAIAKLEVTRTTNDLAARKTRSDQLTKEYNDAVAQNGATPADTTVASVQLKSNSDIDSMVNKVKEFVEKYNELISGMNDSLKEKKYRDFPPLTDEQRKDMTETEQKLWDEKAKSGLHRNDSIVSGGLSDMRNAIYGKVGLDDNVIDTLAEMGITTSSIYSDGGKLVISEDKLKKALTENPDQVVKTLTQSGEKTTSGDTRGIVQRLRDSMKEFTGKIETKAGKASSTDQQYTIGKSLIDTNDRITNFKRRLEDMEARYWKQFTAMETAINKANSQSSYLSQFGAQ
ncbi:flagellar filament capping protein FliD [Psychrobacillus sp. PGGUH221]|uniref:flagellar filament capping protein FliD n=1 Tax=Psychrobacillus sp. PGGUH221 TaxID=3020058 RepID=UPI0035C680BA